MRTYFRNGELVITEQAVILLHKPLVRFAIAELDRVHAIRGDGDPGGIHPSHSTAGGAAVFATAVPATFRWRRSPHIWELRALHRGMNVCLFSTTDVQTFGQVRRAMIRALEASGKL